MFLNQLIAEDVFFSWAKLSLIMISLLILSSICFVMRPIFVLQGLMSRHLISSGKFSL